MEAKNEYSKLYIRTKLFYKLKQKFFQCFLNGILFYLCRRIYPTYPFDFKQNLNI